MTLILHLFITYGIFSLFFVLITSLGGIVVYTLQIYIFFGYILSTLKIFNFYTAYLPFLIIAIVFSIFLHKNKILHGTWTRLIKQLKGNQKEILVYVIIVSIIFLVQFITYWPMISENSALLISDPYYWTRNILYLNQNGLNLYVLVMFTITKRLFRDKFLIFFCLLAVLSNLYFSFRIFLFLSSAISILLILISLIIFLSDIPNYILGFMIPAIFLLNPVYFLFFLLVLIIFYFYKIITTQKDKMVLLRDILKIGLISFMFLSVYVLSVVLIYHSELIFVINYFLQYTKIESLVISLPPINIEIIDIFNLILGGFYSITFFILPIIGIFIKPETKKDNSIKDFYLFIKFYHQEFF